MHCVIWEICFSYLLQLPSIAMFEHNIPWSQIFTNSKNSNCIFCWSVKYEFVCSSTFVCSYHDFAVIVWPVVQGTLEQPDQCMMFIRQLLQILKNCSLLCCIDLLITTKLFLLIAHEVYLKNLCCPSSRGCNDPIQWWIYKIKSKDIINDLYTSGINIHSMLLLLCKYKIK